MSNEININNLRELHAATTQGEWEHTGGDCVWASPDKNNCDVIADTRFDFSDSENRANAAFIAAAHNAMPALLDELERLRACKIDGMTIDDLNRLRQMLADTTAARADFERALNASEERVAELLRENAELTKACEQQQEHIRESDTACARLRGENELRQEAAVVAMEEREELRNALQELLDFSEVLQGRYHEKSNQARENAGKLLRGEK